MLRARISKGGKIAIPAFYRKQLHLEDGEEILFEIQEDRLVLSSLHNALTKARLLVQQHCPPDINLVDELIAMRREEASRE
jgi:bifunctional DNA-binding transcriptional regulator/antitoxin component of YhaV-PrlF toxin-antitoxin module